MPDRDTLRPPVLLLWPPLSDRRNEPDNDRISNRPYKWRMQLIKVWNIFGFSLINDWWRYQTIINNSTNLICNSSTRCGGLPKSNIRYGSVRWQNTNSPWTMLRKWHYFWRYILKKEKLPPHLSFITQNLPNKTNFEKHQLYYKEIIKCWSLIRQLFRALKGIEKI